MRIHILGISGTFMAGIAILAKQKGHDVTGSDKNYFDPMKTVLKENKIKFSKGYNPKVLNAKYGFFHCADENWIHSFAPYL